MQKEKTEIAGIEYDVNKRWEQGIPHHEKSKELFTRLKDLDWLYGRDYFCFKSGGDGDNGEALMYLLDIYFDEKDAYLNYNLIDCTTVEDRTNGIKKLIKGELKESRPKCLIDGGFTSKDFCNNKCRYKDECKKI